MARVQIIEEIRKVSGRVHLTGLGYKVEVVEPGTTTAVTVYQADTGGATYSWFGTDADEDTGTGVIVPFTADPATMTGVPIAAGEMWAESGQTVELRVLTLGNVEVTRMPVRLVSPSVERRLAAKPLDAREYLTTAYTPFDTSGATLIDFAAAMTDTEEQGKALYWPGGLYATPTSKNILLNSTTASWTYKITGDGNSSRLYLPSGMTDGQFVLRMNQDAVGAIITDDFKTHNRAHFEDFMVVGSASPNGGFLSTTQRSFRAVGLTQAFGKWLFQVKGYTDAISLERINVSGLTSGGWAYEQLDNGDGLVVDGLFAAGVGGLKLKGAQGCSIRGLVSGFHEFIASDVMIDGIHLEGDINDHTEPLLSIRGSRVSIPSGRLYTTKFRPAIRIKDNDATGWRSKVFLGKGLTFAQRLGTPGDATYDSTQGTAIDLVGFSTESELRMESVRQDYFGRTAANSGDGTFENGTIKVLSDDSAQQAVIDANPVLLAGDVQFAYRNSAWRLTPPDPWSGVHRTRKVSTPGFAVASQASTAWATDAAAATYYYRAWTINSEGQVSAAAAQENVALTTGNILRLTLTGLAGCSVVIVRGTSSGTYTHWVKITTPNDKLILRDQGSTILGQTWSTTSVPTVPTVNDTEEALWVNGDKPAAPRGIVRNVNPELAINGATVPTANRIFWLRLLEGGAITKVRFNVVTQSGNMCVAFARNTNQGLSAKPGDIISSTGSVAVPAAGDRELTLDTAVTIRAGDWVGFACDSTTAVLRGTTTSSVADQSLASGSSYREDISAGGPAIPTTRAALTACTHRNWAFVGVP